LRFLQDKITGYLSITVILIITALFFGCRPTRFVPEDKYLLNRVTVKCDNKEIDKEELESYIKQKPNRRIFNLFRFHLGVYNFVNSGKERKWKKKIGNIVGEEPVIYDEFQNEKTIKQLSQFLKNKGYYHARVEDSLQYRKQKVNIRYMITGNLPYKVRNVDYSIDDPVVHNIVMSDTAGTLLKKDVNFDVDIMQNERIRIATNLKNEGYYYFSKEYVHYQVDTALNTNQADVTVGIKKHVRRISDDNFIEEDHRKYKVDRIFVYPNYNPKRALEEKGRYFRDLDTLFYKGIYFIYSGIMKIKPDVIIRENYIRAGEYYNHSDVEKTYSQLTALRIYKLINIQFSESPLQKNFLDCIIQLTPLTFQSYTVELEGTNSSGNLGVAGNIIYQHRNLFGGAEIFDVKLKGALQAQTDVAVEEEQQEQIDEYLSFNTMEMGTEARIYIPKFYSPIVPARFFRRYNPKTTISLTYNFQQRPDYTRTIINSSFGYFWKGSQYTRVFFNPVVVNAVEIPRISDSFWDDIKYSYIANSYKDYYITETNYSLVFSSQDINRKLSDFMYFRLYLESAGNILSSINGITKATNEGGTYYVLGRRYAQYVKADYDYRYYQVIDHTNTIVYRAFAGCGYPYGNSSAMPFIKQYFSGGANSVRAWHVRDLGPGSYVDTIYTYPNQSSDIKLEANIEYRFHLFWMLNGALFVDAGNIWAISAEDDREGSLFEPDRFYKEMAIGTGIGFRLDFSFFVFRFDVGIKVREPDVPEQERWIWGNRSLTRDDFGYNVGIGYPF